VNDLSEHPDLAATGAAMRAEWRAEQEAATRDARADWTHRLALVDRLRGHMHRGDTLIAAVAGHRVTGSVEEVGDDLLALMTPAGRVDIQLAPTIPVTFEASAARTGGHRGSDAAGGRFRHALIAREQDARVRLGTLEEPEGLEGQLRVSVDHIALVTPTGRELLVPMTCVAWVAPPDE
jgi:hypothetical protein